MQIKKNSAQFTPQAMPHFEGDVAVAMNVTQGLGEPPGPDDIVYVVHFHDGAINRWHMHESRQILIFTDGEGVVEEREGERHVMGPGDVAVVPKDTAHRHGATPGHSCTHVAIQWGAITWCD